MRSLRCFVLLTLLGVGAKAASQNRDSLLQAYQKAPTADARLSTAHALCVNYLESGHDSTAFYCQEAKILALRLEQTTEAIETMVDLGFWYHRKSQYQKALQEYYQALWLSEYHHLQSLQAETHNNIAISHQRMSKLDSAYYHWSQAERLYNQLGHPAEIWRAYSGLFALFREKGDTVQANEYAALAYDKAVEGASRADRGYIIFQLLQYYFQTEQFELMAKFQQRWDAYKREQTPDETLMQQPAHIALYMYAAEEAAPIEQQLKKAIRHFEQSGVPYRAGWTYEDLAKLYYNKGQPQEGMAALRQACLYYQQAEAPYRQGRALHLLYKWEKAAGNTDQALSYLETYESLEDSLSSSAAEKNLNALRVKAETEKKEQALQIKELELVQKTQERNIFLFSSLLLAALAAAIFLGLRQRLVTNRRIAQQEQKLQQQQIQQLEQQARLTSMQSVIQGQEQERMRIANDLHDSLGGLITSVNNHFAAASKAEEPDKRKALTQRTESLIAQASQELHRISQNLMPRSLTLLGLEGAMEDLASQLREQGLDAQFQAIGLEDRLPEETAVTLYRIAQELTNNILKHAEAQQVLLQLLQRNRSLLLIVEDDGKGFDLEAARQKKSLGMSSIASRVDYLNGTLDMDTAMGEGATITIEVPLQKLPEFQ